MVADGVFIAAWISVGVVAGGLFTGIGFVAGTGCVIIVVSGVKFCWLAQNSDKVSRNGINFFIVIMYLNFVYLSSLLIPYSPHIIISC